MLCPSGLMVKFSCANLPRKTLIILKYIWLFSTAVPSQDLPLVLLICSALLGLQKRNRFKQLCVFFSFAATDLLKTKGFFPWPTLSLVWTQHLNSRQMKSFKCLFLMSSILMEPCNSCHAPHVSLKHNIVKYCQYTNGCFTHEWINGMCCCFPSQDVNNLPHAGSLKPCRTAENCCL